MDKCSKCSGKQYYNKLCKKHFVENIEKRVRKDIRLNKTFSVGDKVLVSDPISEHIVKSLNIPLNIVKKGSHDKNVILWTLDDETIDFMKSVFEGKKFKKKGKKDRLIFRTVKEAELEKYAKAAKLKFSKKKRTKKEEEIKKAIEDIEKKHAETKFSLLKSIENLN